ncbi:MAG: SpoIID/LytB domain-containing protein [bacterium]|nr:SpoIID/LytB domain-containing protein [bacterium]
MRYQRVLKALFIICASVILFAGCLRPFVLAPVIPTVSPPPAPEAEPAWQAEAPPPPPVSKPLMPIVPEKKEGLVVHLPTRVRIGVMERQVNISIVGQGLLVNGEKIEGDAVSFALRESQPAKLIYRIVVGTFRPSNPEIEGLADSWREKGYQVTLKEAGGLFQGTEQTGRDEQLIVDNRVIWLCLGRFEEEEEAGVFRDRLYEEVPRCWILEELVEASSGGIDMFDQDGALVKTYTQPILIASDNPIEVKQVEYGRGYSWEGHQDREFAGLIEIALDKMGRLCLVNELDLEDYLKGVLPFEISPKAPLEALSAQAVAARGETLSKFKQRHLTDPYDLCASQHCQVYGGLGRVTEAVREAVERTRGEVLMYGDKIVDAVYSANCGGHTESNENVWASLPDPCLRGVPDFDPEEVDFPDTITDDVLTEWLTTTPGAYCYGHEFSKPEKFRWKVEYSAGEMNRFINRDRDCGPVKDIILLERGVSGRLKAIKIVAANETFTIYKELLIRQLLGNLRSAAFIVEIKRDPEGNPLSFSFTGGGWGHGVGMCQEGACGMAKKRKGYREILGHYFGKAEIRKIY